MRKILTSRLLLVLVFITSFLFPGYSQSSTVVTLDNQTEIEISKTKIKRYLMKFEVNEDIRVKDLIVSKVNDKYFLLVKCNIINDTTWVYIIELKKKRKKLIFKKSRLLNACQTDEVDISVFNIKDGEIHGCTKCNHKIIGR